MKRIREAEKTYHIYNHAVGKDNLFLNDENYIYFLKKFAEYILPIADIFSCCLMPNHFHFMLRIKPEQELREYYKIKYPKLFENFSRGAFLKLGATTALNLQTSKHFGVLFMSYSKAFNKQNKRMGALFVDDFKRIEVNDFNYFIKLVHYIHYNPVHHGFVKNNSEWKYSSYNSLVFC